MLICPICKQKKIILVNNRVWDTKNRKVYQCFACKVVFLNPMLKGESLKKFYFDYNKYEQTREPNKKECLDKKKKEIESAQRRFAILKKYFKKDHTICEVGASFGYFLDLAKPLVNNLVAIEPSPKEQAILKNKNIKSFDWIEDLPSNLKFDSVFMFHTFEHLPDPLVYLKNLKKYLKPNAKIIVELPNVDDALLSCYKVEEFKQFYFQSMHPFYYNDATLTNIFKKSGFKRLECFHIQRYPFSNHLNWLINKKAGGSVMYEKAFKPINKKYEDILKSKKFTDTILSIFKVN